MDYYQSNLSIIKNLHPKLVERLEGAGRGDDLSLIKTHSGDYTAKINLNDKGIFLHSRYDPQVEATHLIRELDTSIPKIWFIIGLGLGYHLFELANRIDHKSGIVVIERRMDLLKDSLSLFDWSWILQSKEIKLIIAEQIEDVDRSIEGYFPDNFLKGVEVFEHRPSIRLYPKYYSEIKDKLQTLMEKRRIMIQKITATIREDYGRIDLPPDIELHPQTKDKRSYFDFYEEQGKRIEYKGQGKDRIEDVIDCAEGECLEVGCQFGVLSLALAKTGHFVVGVDLSLGYLERAKSILENEPKDVRSRVRYLQAWAEGLPFKDERFKTVVLGELLEHVLDPRDVLREALRVLKPDGVIYISVPAYIEYIRNNPEHVRVFSEKTLLSLLEGFKDLLDLGTLRWYSRPSFLRGNFRLTIRKKRGFKNGAHAH